MDHWGQASEVARSKAMKGAVSMGGSGSVQVPTLSGSAEAAMPLCEECEKKKKQG